MDRLRNTGLMSPVSRLLYCVSCLTSPVSRLLSNVSCLKYPVSSLLIQVSRLLSHISCPTSPVSRLLSHDFCLMSPVNSFYIELSQRIGGAVGRAVRSDTVGHGLKSWMVFIFPKCVKNTKIERLKEC